MVSTSGNSGIPRASQLQANNGPSQILEGSSSRIYLGIDTGGTFTDFVLLRDGQLRIHKVLSTPSAPERAILKGLQDLALLEEVRSGDVRIVHGTTVATNATLEHQGARTLYITNRGLGDVLRIGRQVRRELYELRPVPQPSDFDELPAVEIGGRLAADGSVVDPLLAEDRERIKDALAHLKPEAVAINLLFSFVSDAFERDVEKLIGPGVFVSRSSGVLPEYKEYERGIATWLNARLGPLMAAYLKSLEREVAPSPLAIMQSSGGTIDADQAARKAVNLLLSGPSGGVRAAHFIGEKTANGRLITFDMGGTSTDVSLIDGQIRMTNEGTIGPYPIAVPMAEIQTIGAGGGSIAYLDPGGLLRVGPASAGASPGPACYGAGGELPTVTDAHVVLGTLPADVFLGGRMTLDGEASVAVISRLADAMALTPQQAAAGIIAVANENMSKALRTISVAKGHDPSTFTLVCFGGAGGLHFCALAESLEIYRALIPIHSGVFSALGMLVAPPSRQLTHTHRFSLHDIDAAGIDQRVLALQHQGTDELAAEGIDPARVVTRPSLALRYLGQSYTVSVPWQHDIADAEATFHRLHEQKYGHRLDRNVELLNVQVELTARQEEIELAPVSIDRPAQPTRSADVYGIDGAGSETEVLVCERSSLPPGKEFRGPLLVIDEVSTSLVGRGWYVVRDDLGNLLLSRR